MSIMYIVKSVCATEMVVYIFNHFKRVNEKEISNNNIIMCKRDVIIMGFKCCSCWLLQHCYSV